MFKKVQFFESFFWKEFNFRVFFEKEVTFKKWVRFFESYLKKESSILWVILQKEEGSILLVTLKKFNSLSYIQRRFNFESLSQIKTKVQLLLEEVHKRGSILWVIYKEFNPLSHCWKKNKKVQFFESFFHTGINHFCESKFFVKKKKTFGATRWPDWWNLTSFKLTESMTWFTKIKPRRPNTEKRTNNSRKPHSKWTSLGFDAQQWLTQTRCWRSQWTSYFTKQGQMCPFKGSSTVSPVTVFLLFVRVWSHGARQQARTINFRPQSCD